MIFEDIKGSTGEAVENVGHGESEESAIGAVRSLRKNKECIGRLYRTL